MFPTAPSTRLFLFIFCLLIFDFCCAYPTPYSHTSTVFPRQETTLTSPMTVTQTEKITTGAGTFIQTCTVTLNPIVVDGMDMVKQEKSCVVTPDNGNSDGPGALPSGSSSTVSTQLPSSTSTSSPTSTGTTNALSSTPNVVPSSATGIPSSSTDVLSNTSLPSGTGVSTDTVSPIPTVTSSPPAGSGSVPPLVVSTTLTFVPRPGSSSSVSSPPSGTGSSSVAVPSSGVPVGGIGISSVPSPTDTPQPDNAVSSTDLRPASSHSVSPSPSPSPTASSENAGAAAAFNPPGKTLQVLPIGLGVFAGISVIALVVVGIVTWERRKHRKNFRRLKLAEANSRMGYNTA